MILIARVSCALALAWGLAVAPVGAATVSIADRAQSFADDTTIDLPVWLEDATGVAGVDFVLEYDLADFGAGLSTTLDQGMLFSLVEVNHDFLTDTTSGIRRVKVAAAGVEGLGEARGVLLTLSLDLPCLGYAQGFPGGRTVTLRVLDVHAYDELGQAMTADGSDGHWTLNCTSVGVYELQHFSTLKSLYRD